MAYATIAHVEALNAARHFSATSIPNTTQVVTFLDQKAAELDTLLYEKSIALPVPTTATVALKLLEAANAAGAYSLAEEAAVTSPHLDAARKAWYRARDLVAGANLGIATGALVHHQPRGSSSGTYVIGRYVEL